MARVHHVYSATTGQTSIIPFTREEEAAADAAEAPNPSRHVLTDRQLRLGLIAAGVLPSVVRSSIAAAITNDLEREAMLTWFDHTRAIHWDHPVTQQLMAIAGFDAEQAAAMWLAAAEIGA